MKLAYAMLADSAVMAPNNKLFISGAGIDYVAAATYPALHPLLCVICSMELEDDDYGRSHTLLVEMLSPTREQLAPPLEHIMTFGAHTASFPQKQAFIVNIPMLVLPVAGDYVFRISIDGALVRDLHLQALAVPSAPSQPAEVSQELRIHPADEQPS